MFSFFYFLKSMGKKKRFSLCHTTTFSHRFLRCCVMFHTAETSVTDFLADAGTCFSLSCRINRAFPNFVQIFGLCTEIACSVWGCSPCKKAFIFNITELKMWKLCMTVAAVDNTLIHEHFRSVLWNNDSKRATAATGCCGLVYLILLYCDDSLSNDLLSKLFKNPFLLLDLLVHQRLGEHGLIHLIMAVPSVTNLNVKMQTFDCRHHNA